MKLTLNDVARRYLQYQEDGVNETLIGRVMYLQIAGEARVAFVQENQVTYPGLCYFLFNGTVGADILRQNHKLRISVTKAATGEDFVLQNVPPEWTELTVEA